MQLDNLPELILKWPCMYFAAFGRHFELGEGWDFKTWDFSRLISAFMSRVRVFFLLIGRVTYNLWTEIFRFVNPWPFLNFCFHSLDFPQCQPSVYRNLDDPLRDLRKERAGPNVLCDANLTRAWYRFTLQGEPAELPGSCPEVNKCGSSSTIWLPRANVIKIGQQVEMKACVTWTVEQTRFCCFWTFSIFVRHCGDFKVYRLQKPTESCSTLYCSNGEYGDWLKAVAVVTVRPCCICYGGYGIFIYVMWQYELHIPTKCGNMSCIFPHLSDNKVVL